MNAGRVIGTSPRVTGRVLRNRGCSLTHVESAPLAATMVSTKARGPQQGAALLKRTTNMSPSTCIKQPRPLGAAGERPSDCPERAAHRRGPARGVLAGAAPGDPRRFRAGDLGALTA